MVLHRPIECTALIRSYRQMRGIDRQHTGFV
jgi:hypothetical protein